MVSTRFPVLLALAALLVAPGCRREAPAADGGSAGMLDGGSGGGGCDSVADCNTASCCAALQTAGVACTVDTTCGSGGGGVLCESDLGPENTAARCRDECSNDDDDFVDCDDFDCCDVRTDCRETAPDTSCGRLPPPGERCEGDPEPEDTLAACSDGCSNDDDDFVDCDDFDCCDVRTDCRETAPDTSCGRLPPPAEQCEGEPEPEDTLAACTDGCSNDDDGERIFTDCDEADCCYVRAAAAARGEVSACPAGTFCGDRTFLVDAVCPGELGPPVPENSYERCTNGCNDDRNGSSRQEFFDCDEFDCCPIIAAAVEAGVEGAEACGATTGCGDRPPSRGELCADDDGTGEPDAENSADACRNACDDDRDGFVDCDDFDCCDFLTDCPGTSSCGRVAD
jgi:hypothetical protein